MAEQTDTVLSLCAELDRRLGETGRDVLPCETHGERPAVALCARCARALCAECVRCEPDEPRCNACRRVNARLLPERLRPAWTFLAALLSRRWALSFVGASTAFAALLILAPEMVRPQPPKLPTWLRDLRLNAPLLEKAYRLRETGDRWRQSGHSRRARTYYARAGTACREYLNGEKRPLLQRQTRLGMGRLLERSGDSKAALQVYRSIVDAGDPRSGGAAHFYLARILETQPERRQDALEHYRRAMALTEHDGDSLDRMLTYYAAERPEDRHVYAIAALTDTITSASAVHAELVAALVRFGDRTDTPPHTARNGSRPRPPDEIPVVIRPATE